MPVSLTRGRARINFAGGEAGGRWSWPADSEMWLAGSRVAGLL